MAGVLTPQQITLLREAMNILNDDVCEDLAYQKDTDLLRKVRSAMDKITQVMDHGNKSSS